MVESVVRSILLSTHTMTAIIAKNLDLLIDTLKQDEITEFPKRHH